MTMIMERGLRVTGMYGKKKKNSLGIMTKNNKEMTFHLYVIAIVVVLVGMVDVTWAHVGLTFPPARQYDLDFLDNIRTKPPCGMPKGSIKTSLLSGSTINVTWHLSYPHRGGYQLELMDSQERSLLNLTPKNGDEDYIKGNPTAQSHEVKLPDNFTCDGCTIRLLRQASEWANSYRFWSCADVDILPAKQYRLSCSNAGKAVAGRCVCNKGFWGNRCQYEDECATDAECNSNGKCIDLGGTALPKKQCFCNAGFHGEKCRKRNLVKLPRSEKDLDLNRYTKRVLSERMTLHYKIIPNKKEENKEIEFVLIVQGTSYGALGWRPKEFTKTCKRWPVIENGTIPETNSEGDRQGKNAKLETAASDPKAEAEPKSEPSAEPESAAAEPETASSKEGDHHKKKEGAHAEPEPESAAAEPEISASEPEPTSEPEGTAEPETSPEDSSASSSKESSVSTSSSSSKSPFGTTPKPGSIADRLRSRVNKQQKKVDGDVSVETSQIVVTRTTKSRQKRSPEDPKAEPESEPETEPEPKSEPEPETNSEPEPEGASSEPEPEGSAKIEADSEPEAEAEAESEPEPSDSTHSGSSVSKTNLKASIWAPTGDFHAMDCIDLVMGAARGQYSRILDYYTRDRSTPRVDSFYGGKDDITSATGWEEGDKTVLIFRRRLRTNDPADHPIKGEMHVIWARGQENGDYVHKPKSGLEVQGSPSRPDFYAPDEIKYHGHGAQRGITRIDFVAEQASGKKKTQAGDCENGWAYPPGCSNADSAKPCTYNATWKYLPDIDSVRFTVETRKPDRWTGIGFNDAPSMKQADAVLGWVTSGGQFFHLDSYMSGYNAPTLDRNQDISNMTGKYRDGIVHWSFVRKIKSTDSMDVSLDECRYFLFPVSGGTYNAVSKKIKKHEDTPIASAEKICISRTCKPVKISKPAELRYQFNLKITEGFGENWKAPPKGSEDFNELDNKVGSLLSSELKKLGGYNQLRLSDIKRDGKGAFASWDLMVKPNSELADKSRVERALKDTVGSGRVGNFMVDPQSLQLKASTLEDSDDEPVTVNATFGGKRLYIVIGCVAALIVLALIQAGLTIYKVAGKTSSHKDSSGSGMAWRDYSETNYGYDAYDEKHMGPTNTMPLTATSPHHHYAPTNGHNSNGYGHGGGGGAGGMSLPRPQHSSQPQSQNSTHSMRHNGGGGGPRSGGGGGGLNHNPDFYFMPSQRKYSGEVVSVYVDNPNTSKR